MSVNNVEFIEYGCKSLTGTLYLSNFRIVFVPDNDNEENTCVCYILTFTYDIIEHRLDQILPYWIEREEENSNNHKY